MWDNFREEGRERFGTAQADKADLFDAFAPDQGEAESLSERMGCEMGSEYYKDMKSALRMQCDHGVVHCHVEEAKNEGVARRI